MNRTISVLALSAFASLVLGGCTIPMRASYTRPTYVESKRSPDVKIRQIVAALEGSDCEVTVAKDSLSEIVITYQASLGVRGRLDLDASLWKSTGRYRYKHRYVQGLSCPSYKYRRAIHQALFRALKD